MNNKFLLGALLACFAVPAVAEPGLIITPATGKGGRLAYTVEFAADPAQPVSALVYEIKTTGAKKAEVGKNPSVDTKACLSGVRPPFTGVCNPATASGNIRVVIYATEAGAALPSGVIGTISLPRSLAKLGGGNRPDLGMVEFTNPEGKVIEGEILVDAANSSK